MNHDKKNSHINLLFNLLFKRINSDRAGKEAPLNIMFLLYLNYFF
jgi:hypothetical protein